MGVSLLLVGAHKTVMQAALEHRELLYLKSLVLNLYLFCLYGVIHKKEFLKWVLRAFLLTFSIVNDFAGGLKYSWAIF